MEGFTLTPVDLDRFTEMFSESQRIIREQAEIITGSKIALMTAKQVGELTGYDEKTIRIRKKEIGYSTLGKDLKFKPADVEAWINRNYRSPK